MIPSNVHKSLSFLRSYRGRGNFFPPSSGRKKLLFEGFLGERLQITEINIPNQLIRTGVRVARSLAFFVLLSTAVGVERNSIKSKIISCSGSSGHIKHQKMRRKLEIVINE